MDYKIEIALNEFEKYNKQFCLDASNASNNGNHIIINNNGTFKKNHRFFLNYPEGNKYFN